MWTLVRNNALATVLGAILSHAPQADKPATVQVPQQELRNVEESQDNSLWMQPVPQDFVAAERQKGPPVEVLSERAVHASREWVKIADLPAEPGLYFSRDLENRQVCHLAVGPANNGESRMLYSLHCGVDTVPKSQLTK